MAFDVLLFSDTPPVSLPASAANDDDDDAMDTTNEENTSDDHRTPAPAPDEGYSGDNDSPGVPDDDSASDAPGVNSSWASRGRQPRARMRPSPYNRSPSDSSSRGGSLTRRSSEPFVLGLTQLHIPSPRTHSPAMVAPSPLFQLAFSHPNSKSPPSKSPSPSGESMDVDQPDEDISEATLLNAASLRLIPLPYLKTFPTPLLVVCTHCECGLVPQSAVKHATNKHSIVLTKVQRRTIQDILTTSAVIKSPAGMERPKHPCPPFESLAHHEGFVCTLCQYCGIADSSLYNHIRDKHPGAKGTAASHFKPGTLQAFSTLHPQYFRVVPVLATIDDEENLFSVYLKQHAPYIDALEILNPPLDHLEVPPLLVVTLWHTHLASYLGDRTKVALLRELVRLPTSTTGEQWLGDCLRKTIEKYMKDAARNGNHAPLGVRSLLKECPRSGPLFLSRGGVDCSCCSVRLSQSGDYWIPLPDNTIEIYAKLLHQWSHAIMLSLEGHESGYTFPLTDEDKHNASELKAALIAQPQELHVELFHTFIKPLFYPKDHSVIPGPYSKFNEPFECLYALSALRADGNFQPSDQVTQLFARMKYFVRGTMLHEGLSKSTGDLYKLSVCF